MKLSRPVRNLVLHDAEDLRLDITRSSAVTFLGDCIRVLNLPSCRSRFRKMVSRGPGVMGLFLL